MMSKILNKLKSNSQSLLGTFVKTPSHIIVEVLAESGLDFMILDAEHSPFDRPSLDICIMTAKLKKCPVIVRIENDSPSSILNALDLGADGVSVPHVKSKEQAEKIVKLAHYGAGGRGYAGSTRAASYGEVSITDHLKSSEKNTFVMIQIEDPEGVENIDEISKVKGIDCIFIGRVDLTVSYNKSDVNDEAVNKAIEKICKAAHLNKVTTGTFLANLNDHKMFKEMGMQVFAIGSEHQMIKQGFKSLRLDKKWMG